MPDGYWTSNKAIRKSFADVRSKAVRRKCRVTHTLSNAIQFAAGIADHTVIYFPELMLTKLLWVWGAKGFVAILSAPKVCWWKDFSFSSSNAEMKRRSWLSPTLRWQYPSHWSIEALKLPANICSSPFTLGYFPPELGWHFIVRAHHYKRQPRGIIFRWWTDFTGHFEMVEKLLQAGGCQCS